MTIGATTVMADIAASELVRRHFAALAEAAAVVGSVQIRNRATLAGNICNASPAADTAPPLLVYGAVVVAAGPKGTRRIPIDEFFVRSGVTTLARGELVIAIELPRPDPPDGRRPRAAHAAARPRPGLGDAVLRRGRSRRDPPRVRQRRPAAGPVVDESGVLADPGAADEAKAPIFERMFADASPSKRSMRASPEYRLAMLRVLGARALRTAIERLAAKRSAEA